MKTSEQTNELMTALVAAQKEMKIAAKNAQNPHFKSRYADFESVRDTASKLAEQGIAFVQGPVVTDGRVGVTTRLSHAKSGQWIESEFTMPPSKNDAQGYMACLTYARRGALAAMIGLATGDDDDGETAVGRGEANKTAPAAKPTSTPPPPSPAKPADKVPDSVAALKPGETCAFSSREVEKLWQPEGKKTKRVKFVGDLTHYVTFRHMNDVKAGDKISGEISFEKTEDGKTFYQITD